MYTISTTTHARHERNHFWWLQAKSEEALQSLSAKLTENKVDHKLWIEQPENIPTCIATKPYPKSEIQSYFKKFKLFK